MIAMNGRKSDLEVRPAPVVTPYEAGPLRWIVRRDIAPRKIGQVLDDPDSFLDDSSRLLANSELITMGLVLPLEPGDATLVLRRLNYGRPRHRLRDIFRPTRAQRAFKHGLGLEQAGVNTPRVLAAGVHRFLRWPVRAYLITEYIPKAITLEDFMLQHHSLPKELVNRLADLLARLHESGFVHLDLKSSNVLFDEQLQPWLIDLDGVRHYGHLSETKAAANLARLMREFLPYPRDLRWKSPRFLKRYCQQRRLESHFRQLAREASEYLTDHFLTTG